MALHETVQIDYTMETRRDSLRIATLVQETGVSKELIHHYLREGLLPRPQTSGQYDAKHVRLLQLIKRLRDERFLPLPVIRDLLEFHAYDPEAVEVVLLSSAPGRANHQGATAQDALDGEPVTLLELHEMTGVPVAELESYAAARLIRPTGAQGAELFSRRDGNIVALVRQGLGLGVPRESFRTIRSYVEMAFELEQSLLFPQDLPDKDVSVLVRELALRKEVINGFVVNVLASLIHARLSTFLAEAGQGRSSTAGDGCPYVPSEAFVRKHGIHDRIDALRARVGRRLRSREAISELAWLFVVSGRYREAVFVVEQAASTGRDGLAVRRIHAYALALAGEVEPGIALLAELKREHADDALTAAWLASAELKKMSALVGVEARLQVARRIHALASEAMALPHGTREDEAEVLLACGWVFTRLPAMCKCHDRGIAALDALVASTDPAAESPLVPEWLRIRLRVAAACLLVGALCRTPARASSSAAAARAVMLRNEVLTMDPASEAAMKLFLES